MTLTRLRVMLGPYAWFITPAERSRTNPIIERRLKEMRRALRNSPEARRRRRRFYHGTSVAVLSVLLLLLSRDIEAAGRRLGDSLNRLDISVFSQMRRTALEFAQRWEKSR